jgi:methylamine--corrinoid protein Co-methyltransferase
VREALRSAGRPGLHLLDACPSALGTISACDPQNGLRKTDAIALPLISELKVNFEILNKVAYSISFGCLRNPYWTIMVGGFAGGPEGAAIVNVAAAINAIMVYYVGGAGYVNNSSLLQSPPISTSAGPGTEQQLWEIAALGIHISCVGGHVLHGCRKSVLVKPNQGTGMEPRWQGEVARAGASLSRQEANEIVNFILSKYENSITPEKAPLGYSFNELYDYETVKVKPEYFDLYFKVKTQLEGQGLKFN